MGLTDFEVRQAGERGFVLLRVGQLHPFITEAAVAVPGAQGFLGGRRPSEVPARDVEALARGEPSGGRKSRAKLEIETAIDRRRR